MKLRRVLARDADPREYIDGANAAFGRWGDEALFAWAFRGDAELLFLEEEGRVVAGSGVNFRTLSSGETAAIMTGSWTLPEGRGRGAFTHMVEATCAIARERGGVLLAFVRAENPSARRLAALGARMTPTFYCRSINEKRQATVPVLHDEGFPSSFVYTDDEWRAQVLERPGANIECIHGDGWRAVVEHADGVDRVHAITDERAIPLLAHPLFWFTTRRPSINCEWTDGFLAELPASRVSEWILQNGDRI